MTDASQVLYRMYDQSDQLLYVGITARPAERFGAHRAEKLWWPQITTIRLEHFAKRKDVLAAELSAIRTEHPLYNLANLPGWQRLSVLPALEDSLAHLSGHERGEWCGTCEGWPHEPVTGKDGWCERCDVHADDHEWDAEDLEHYGPTAPRPPDAIP